MHKKHLPVSSDILPYKKQLVALTWFFKEKKNPSEDEIKELKKWFYYTSYCQTFQNSSLSNVRSVFRRFEDFIKGRKSTAIDYEPIEMKGFGDDKFTINSAKANFMMLSIIHHAQKQVPIITMNYMGYIRMGGKDAANYFPELLPDDKTILSNCFYFNGNYSDQELDRFVLTKEMLMLFISGQKDKFVEARNKAIVDCEKELLKEQGIVMKEEQ